MGAEAICGSVGCIAQPVDGIAAGVELTIPSNSAGPKSVWLLSGTYGPTTPTVDSTSGTSVLSAFLGDSLKAASASKGSGFELYASATTAGAVQVSLAQDVGVVVYSESSFRGTPQVGSMGATNGQGGGRSAVVAENTYVVFKVAGASDPAVATIQVWDGLADSFALGLGNALLQPDAVQSASAVSNSTNTCIKGSYRAALQCNKCDTSCATCYGGSTSQCLSCPPAYHLLNGRCTLATCSGGATTASDLGICLESLVTRPRQEAQIAVRKTISTSPVIIAAAVFGGMAAAVLIGFVIRIIIIRRRKRAEALPASRFDYQQQLEAYQQQWGGYGAAAAAASPYYAAQYGWAGYPTPSRPTPSSSSRNAWPLANKSPPAAYPHFGVGGSHKPYEDPNSARSSRDDGDRDRYEKRVSVEVEPIRFRTAPKRRKKRPRQELQSGWLRRLTGNFAAAAAAALPSAPVGGKRKAGGRKKVPAVPPIPSTFFDAPLPVTRPASPTTTIVPPSVPPLPVPAIKKTDKLSALPTSASRPAPNKSALLGAGAKRQTGMTWVSRWRADAADAPFIPPPSPSPLSPTPPTRVSQPPTPLSKDSKRPRVPMSTAKISAPVSRPDPLDMNEGRRRPTTRVAAWLAAGSGAEQDEDEGGGASVDPGETEAETLRQRRESGMSDWDKPRSQVARNNSRAAGKGRMRSVY